MMKITLTDYERAAAKLGCSVAAVRAVAQVESGPYGAFLASGEPVILFERHKFHLYTQGKYSSAHPDISNGRPGGYGKVSDQHARMGRAASLDRNAALMAASWGLFQVLGYNWESLDYDSLQQFVNSMYKGEPEHLDSFIRYVVVNDLARHLQSENWAAFARGYNGRNYRQFFYDTKIQAAFEVFK